MALVVVGPSEQCNIPRAHDFLRIQHQDLIERLLEPRILFKMGRFRNDTSRFTTAHPLCIWERCIESFHRSHVYVRCSVVKLLSLLRNESTLNRIRVYVLSRVGELCG